MKKIFLLCCGIAGMLAASAQLDKGRLLLGGRATFSSDKTKYDSPLSGPYTVKETRQSYGILAGVFLRTNLLAGVSLGYQRKPSFAANQLEGMPKIYSGGLLLRRYFPVGKGFYFHLGGALNYTRGVSADYITQTYSGRDTYQQLSFGVAPGISFAFGRRILLETGFNNVLSAVYKSKVTKEAGTGNTLQRDKSFAAGFGENGSVPFNIGFNFLFGK